MSRGLELIITHENTDFDALAAELAAHKLYPEARPVVPRRPNRNVRDFLTLYWDELPFVQWEDIPRRAVVRLIMVDTQTAPMPKRLRAKASVHIIDHHPLSRELPPGWSFSGDEVGATTTLIIENIRAAGLSVSPIEATLLLLGIYEDTGSLSYTTTTPRDLLAGAWLLEQGANLNVVNDFLRHPLTEAQRRLYNKLLEKSSFHDYHGHSVVISTAVAEEYVEEISTLAHQLRDVFDPAALFLLVDMGDRIQVIARSATPSIDVAEVLANLDGGGHSQAAAAVIRGASLEESKARLMELLHILVHPTVTVRQIMSFGVHTVQPDTTVHQADALMRRYGHEGFPVVEEGKVVGFVTRREIDRAMQHNLGRAPIRTYMYTGDFSVSPDDSVERVQNVMISYGLGQVPVVENGRVIGIVTRTDLIKLWSTPRQPSRAAEIRQRIAQTLPEPILALVQQAAQVGDELGYSLYLVGGFVRDLLLDIPNLDLDIVVEGDAIRLARRLAARFGGRVRSHRRFGTAKWLIPESLVIQTLTSHTTPEPQRLEGESTDVEATGPLLALDFTTARTEFYSYPTALPEVERSSIKQDLHRRDFTINTLAICLNPDHYGELLDFYGGRQDLENGIIRVLHSLSFVEDPTRILRAVRFEQRLSFHIEPRTEELIDDAVGLLDRVSGERIRHELFLILDEAEPELALRRLDKLGVLARIHPALHCDDWLVERFRSLRQALADGFWKLGAEANWPRAGYLALLTYRLLPTELEAFIARLVIVKDDSRLLREVSALQAYLPNLGGPEPRPSELARWLRPYSLKAVFLLRVANDSPIVQERLDFYYRRLHQVRPVIDGTYLRQLGISPGPVYRRVLDAVRDARLDGEITTEAEEKALVERLLSAYPKNLLPLD